MGEKTNLGAGREIYHTRAEGIRREDIGCRREDNSFGDKALQSAGGRHPGVYAADTD